MLDNEVGYIKLAQFSQKTATDVEEAIRKLKTQGMKKLVLDLRSNPGGLLNQAIEVGELFLKKGNKIVSTRGRTQETESPATRDGILKADVPMVVLMNQGSASASEIVAGALQDWDRALIVGKTSFGKGSVQTILPLDNQGHALKLTTAFYYLPFGRCINKPENGIKGLSLREEEVDPETGEPLSPDSAGVDSAAKDTQVYFTASGRKMYGGGGIVPDVDIELKPMPWIVQVQERMALYFRFAVKYRAQLEKSKVKVDANWAVPDSIFMAFKEFCLKDTNYVKVKSNAQATTDLLEEILLKEQGYMGDSSKNVSDPELAARIADLRKTLQRQTDAQFDANKGYIMDAIKRELVASYQGEEARIAFTLRSDNQVGEALRYLKDMSLFKRAMQGEFKGKPETKAPAAEKVTAKKGKK
jgi:carboxyl-terminal processing protease